LFANIEKIETIEIEKPKYEWKSEKIYTLFGVGPQWTVWAYMCIGPSSGGGMTPNFFGGRFKICPPFFENI
jgi:hypothetical protein